MDEMTAADYRRTIEALMQTTTADDLPSALTNMGFLDALADDSAAALGSLFFAAGLQLNDAPIWDLTIPTVTADHLPQLVLPMPLSAHAPGRIQQGDIVVDGMIFGLATGPYAVPLEDRIVLLASGSVRPQPLTGLNPVSASRISATVPVGLPIGTIEQTWEQMLTMLHRCLAHSLIGLGHRMLTATVEHVTTRHQFGRAIGTFQTVQHRLADMRIALVGAEATLDASWRSGDPKSAAVAKAHCGDAAMLAAKHSQQLFGAMGFTWEQGLHAAVKRVLLLEALGGSSEALQSQVGQSLFSNSRLDPVDAGF